MWLGASLLVVTVLLVGGGWMTATGLARPEPPALATTRSAGPAGTAESADPDGSADQDGLRPTPLDAVTAATVAIGLLSQPEVVLDPAVRDRVLAERFTVDAAQVEAAELAAAAAELTGSAWADQPASRRTFFSTLLAASLSDWTVPAGDAGAEATVGVWSMTILGVGDAGGAVFTTSTLRLTWTDGRWRITSVDTVEGPTPMLTGMPSVPGELRALLRDALPTVPMPLLTVEDAA